MRYPRTPLPRQSPEYRLITVQDTLQPCPYLDDMMARMPLQLPVGPMSAEVTDEILALGYRRSGDFLYRTKCPRCDECRPTRVLVDDFRLTESMRRVLKRGDRDLTVHWGRPLTDQQRVDLFNRHRSLRRLGSDKEPIDAASYRSFLVDSCCETLELSISYQQQLIGISIVDIGRRSTSAVYTQYEPELSRYSLGTYAILKQIEWARQTSRKYVYLGMYVADNRHLNYKGRFHRQQRLVDGSWVDIDSSPHSAARS